MALPTTLNFADYIVEFETAPGSGLFAPKGGFTQRQTDLSASTSSVLVPDNDDPTAPGWELTGVSGLSAQFQGAAIYAAEDELFWGQWFDSGLPKLTRIRKPGVAYRQGPLLITALGDSVQLGSDGNLMKRSMTLKNSGAFPIVAGDPA